MILIDTNIFLRASDASSVHHADCVGALDILSGGTEPSVTCAQVLIEFWSAATRPRQVNGIGMSPTDAWRTVSDVLRSFPCLDEPPRVIDLWSDLVSRYQVMGKTAHDARLVAVMTAHGVGRLLTLNVADFRRYREIDSLTPADVLATGNP